MRHICAGTMAVRLQVQRYSMNTPLRALPGYSTGTHRVLTGGLCRFLRRESAARGATVVLCTHLFDGLDGWPTHLVHMHGTAAVGSSVERVSNGRAHPHACVGG